MNAVDEDVAQVIDLVSLEVDFFGGVLSETSLLKLELFFEVNDLIVALFYQRVVVALEISYDFILVLAGCDEVFHVLTEHSTVCLVPKRALVSEPLVPGAFND